MIRTSFYPVEICNIGSFNKNNISSLNTFDFVSLFVVLNISKNAA